MVATISVVRAKDFRCLSPFLDQGEDFPFYKPLTAQEEAELVEDARQAGVTLVTPQNPGTKGAPIIGHH